MVASWTDGDALNRLYVVWQFDKLHGIAFKGLLNYGLANCVDHFCLAVLLDDADFIFGVECEVGAESVVEIKVHLFFLLLHLNIEVVYIIN